MANRWEPYRDAIHLFQPLWLPTVAQLDAYETQAGFRFPASYREFALAFGYGVLYAKFFTDGVEEDGRFENVVGIPRQNHEHDYDLANLTKEFHRRFHPQRRSARHGAAEYTPLARGLIYFATERVRGWFYGWDITEVTNPDAHEYAIYRLGDGDDGQTEPLRVAESFEHFIVDVLCDGRFELSEPGKGRRYQINYNQDQDATGFSFHADYPDQ